MFKKTLSICMIVKNEEETLKKTIPVYVAGASEVIVVDTGSTDNTAKVAKELGAKVYTFPWINDFSAARNESIKYAVCDYILWIDADEYIKPNGLNRIRAYIDSTFADIIHLQITECVPYETITGESYFRDKVFKNHIGTHFERSINEQVVPIDFSNAKIERIENIFIYHWGRNLGQDKLKEKFKERIDLFQKAIEKNKNDIYLHYLLGYRYFDAGRRDDGYREFEIVLGLEAKRPSEIFVKEKCALMLGWKHFDNDKYEDALKYALFAINLFVKNAESYCLAASCLLILGRAQEAVNLLEKVYSQDKIKHPLYSIKDMYWDYMRFALFGNASVTLKKYDKAFDAYSRALEAEPHNSEIKSVIDSLKGVK